MQRILLPMPQAEEEPENARNNVGGSLGSVHRLQSGTLMGGTISVRETRGGQRQHLHRHHSLSACIDNQEAGVQVETAEHLKRLYRGAFGGGHATIRRSGTADSRISWRTLGGPEVVWADSGASTTRPWQEVEKEPATWGSPDVRLAAIGD